MRTEQDTEPTLFPPAGLPRHLVNTSVANEQKPGCPRTGPAGKQWNGILPPHPRTREWDRKKEKPGETTKPSYTENSQQEVATVYSKIQKKRRKMKICTMPPPSPRYTKQTKGHVGNTGFDHRPTGWEANGALWDKKALQGRKRARAELKLNWEESMWQSIKAALWNWTWKALSRTWRECSIQLLNKRRHTKMTDNRSHFSKEEIKKMRPEVATDSYNWQNLL